MTTLLERRIGDVTWQVLPGWEATLLGPGGLRLEQWRRQSAVRVVKHGEHRTVYCVELPDRAFYVKHYRCARFWDIARHLVRASAAGREWRKTEEVIRRGIATIRPVAWGQRVRGPVVSDNYFVSEAIPQACSLEQWVMERLPGFRPQVQAELRRRLIVDVARFVASIHQAGIRHNDFHAGNVLVQLPLGQSDTPGPVPSPRMYLIDLPGVRFSESLDWPASVRSLVMFNSAWWERTSAGEKWRFWRTYLAARPTLELPDPRRAAEKLERGSREFARRNLRRRDRRALQTNRQYTAVRHPCGEAYGVRDLAEEELVRILEDPEDLLWRNLDRPVKLGHGGLMVEAELPSIHGPIHVAYKCYRPQNWWKAMCGLWRRGRGFRGWYLGQALVQRKLATARPLALWLPRGGRLRHHSYLAVEWIEGAENLHLYGWRLAGLPPAERLRRAGRVAESLGRLIGRMHAWQIAHGDLKGSNLLVLQQGQRVDTYLIDVEDVRITNRLSANRQVADLARLAASIEAHPWVTRTIRCRFLRAYVGQFPPGSVVWKPLWHRVGRRSRQITRRKRRRGEAIL